MIIEEEAQDPYEKVTKVAEKVGIIISEEKSGVHHQLPFRKAGPRSLIAQFIRQETKPRMMAQKKELKFEDGSKEPNNFVNDDITSLRAKIMQATEDKPAAKRSVDEKLIAFFNNGKLPFEKLHKLQKSDLLPFFYSL